MSLVNPTASLLGREAVGRADRHHSNFLGSHSRGDVQRLDGPVVSPRELYGFYTNGPVNSSISAFFEFQMFRKTCPLFVVSAHTDSSSSNDGENGSRCAVVSLQWVVALRTKEITLWLRIDAEMKTHRSVVPFLTRSLQSPESRFSTLAPSTPSRASSDHLDVILMDHGLDPSP